jgi:hypothetical protein
VLGDYDLVFAKGRAALESLVVGAAVVLCDWKGIGPLVTAREFDRIRSLNFGIRTLRLQISEDLIEQCIAQYDRDDAADVSRRARLLAGREEAVDRIEAVYRDVLREFQSTPKCDLVEEERAASAYLRWLTPRLKDQTAAASTWLEAQLKSIDQVGQPGERNVEEVRSPCTDTGSEDCLSDGRQRRPRTSHVRSATAEACPQVESTNKETPQTVTQDRLSAVQAQLSISEAQLSRITGSLGWRIISRYGPIKYRFVLPAYHRIKRLLGLEDRAG